ncbi:T9SS type A sorting domain-containing protein [bacterium]|nr:T9SS type A sorting domain-containing protein [bacterium]
MRLQQLSSCTRMLILVIVFSIESVVAYGVPSFGVYEGARFSPTITVISSSETAIRLSLSMDNLPPTTQELDIQAPFEGLVANMLEPEEHPLIPRFTIFLALPPSGNPTVTAESWQTETYGVINPAFIPENDPSYPEVRLGDIQVLGGIRLVPLTIKPVEYVNNSASCTIMTNAVIQVNIDGSAGTLPQTSYPESFSIPWQRVLTSVVTNWEAIPDILNGADSHLLIICPDEYLAVIQNFVDWKEQRGMTVTVVALSSISSSPSAIQIKQRIQSEFISSSPRIDYVLLVGDESKIPPAYRFTEDPISRFSDYTYDDGSFTDENHYAAIGDNDDIDVFPEVFVGRWVVNNQSEVVSIANRSIFHERDVLLTENQRFSQAALAADFTEVTQAATKRHCREMLLERGFTRVDTLWAEPSPGPQNLVNWINEGVTFVNYRGSGWSFGWAGISFYLHTIANIANTGRLPIITAIGCGVGKYDVDDGQCFGEAWMTQGTPSQPSGAVGFIGPCWNTHTVYNDCLDSSIYRAFLDYDVLNLGAALAAGKVYTWGLFEDFLNEDAVLELCRTMIRQYLLLSDPSLQVFTETPVRPIINLPDAIMAGPFDQEITVENMASLAADSVLLTVWYESGSFENYWIKQGTPTISIQVNALNDQMVHFTVTGENVAPFQRQIQVSPTGPYVIHHDAEFSDAQDGNGNGLIEPGETIRWTESVWNVGTEAAQNVAATLSTETAGMTVIDHTVQFGTLTSGQIAAAAVPFTFSVNAAAPENRSAEFVILYSADNADPRFSEIELTLHAPDIQYNSIIVDDENNGYLERWESAYLRVAVSNQGNLANAVGHLQLISYDPYLTIEDGWTQLPAVLPNQTAMTAGQGLRVHAVGITPSAHEAEITVHIEFEMDRYTYSKDIPITLVIGRIETTDPLSDSVNRYWLYDNLDAIYEQVPEFEWIEISPSAGGPGTPIEIEGFNQTVTVDVPFDYSYYGVNYQTLAVSADGWVQPGTSTQSSPFSDALPYPWDTVNGMIAPLWGDLWNTSQEETGDLSYFYDESLDRFIVEWSHLHNDWFQSFQETFQLHLLNPAAYPTPTGDAEWLFMYDELSPIVQSIQGYTIGIENQSSLEGMTYVSRGMYAPAANYVESGTAIRITTIAPTILDTGETPATVPTAVSLAQNYPNPFNPQTLINFTLTSATQTRLEIFNILGQKVATLVNGPMDAGTHTVIWDSRSDADVLAGSGVYLYRLTTPQTVLSRKMVLLK